MTLSPEAEQALHGLDLVTPNLVLDKLREGRHTMQRLLHSMRDREVPEGEPQPVKPTIELMWVQHPDPVTLGPNEPYTEAVLVFRCEDGTSGWDLRDRRTLTVEQREARAKQLCEEGFLD